MGLFDIIEGVFKDHKHSYETGYAHGKNGNRRTNDYSEYTKGYNDGYWEENRNKHALTCNKCSGDALPVRGTTRNYACECGNKFSGTKHPFSK